MLGSLQGTGRRNRKKLIEAAELWAGGQFVSEQEHDANQKRRQASFQALNISVPAGVLDSDDEVPEFWLWPENERTWLAFLGCSSQWRESVKGREGLDYSGVDVVLGKSGMRPRARREAWHRIQAMEFACLRVWAQRRP